MAAISSVTEEIIESVLSDVTGTWPDLARGIPEQYLRSLDCLALVELQLNLFHSQADEREHSDLALAFQHEFLHALGVSTTKSRHLAIEVWSEIRHRAQGRIRHVAASDKIVIRVQGPGQPIAERLGLAADPARRRVALDTGAAIRKAMADEYSRMRMPHSRKDFRLEVDLIYVPRSVQPLDKPHSEYWPVPETDLVDRRFVVVGNPGAGKSTFIRNLVHRVARSDGRLAPVVVLLKQHQTLTEDFVSIVARELRTRVQREVPRQEIADLFDCGDGLVVFDGLDEVGDLTARRAAVTAIEAFAARFPLARIVVTCRQESYPMAVLPKDAFPVYWLPDFTDHQVEHYVHTWFSLVPDGGDALAEAFRRDSEHVRDLRSNPLMLSLLCMLYKSEGYIPENTADVYRECAELMLVRWDSVSRVPSVIRSVKLAKFLVQELAQHFFFALDGKGAEEERTLRRLVVAHLEQREEEGAQTFHERAQEFLDYCAERAWVLTQIDTSPDGERMFGFTHRTFMEYWAACHVLRTHQTSEELVKCLAPMINSARSHVLPQVALQMFDLNRADGGDACVRLMLTGPVFQPLVLFCLKFFQHNNIRLPTASMLLTLAFGLANGFDSREMLNELMALKGASRVRAEAVAREVLARTESRRYDATNVRFGASLFVPELAPEEMDVGAVRYGMMEPRQFVAAHGGRALVYLWTGDECVPGPVVRAIGDIARTEGWGPRGSMTLLTAALPAVPPIPLSVLPRLVREFDAAGAVLLRHAFRSRRGGFTGLFCAVAAAAHEADLGWSLPDKLWALPGNDLGERLLHYCDPGEAMRPFRACLERWARGEMSFVDFDR